MLLIWSEFDKFKTNLNNLLTYLTNFFYRMPKQNIYYSDKYEDEKFEYRHVMLPKDLAKMVPKSHLMSETEWRSLGVQQSQVDAEYF